MARQLAPPARKGHTLVAVQSLLSAATGKRAPAIVLFAGRVDFSTYFDDVWAYFPSQGTWEKLGAAPAPRGAPGASAPRTPHPRDHHGAAVVGDAMYVYGGWYQYWHAFDDVWRYDLSARAWTALAPVGAAPPGRFLISLVPVGADLYLFGGELGSDERNAYKNDVWAFSTQSHEWTELSPSRCPRDHSTTPRPPRSTVDEDEEDDERSDQPAHPWRPASAAEKGGSSAGSAAKQPGSGAGPEAARGGEKAAASGSAGKGKDSAKGSGAAARASGVPAREAH